MRAVPDTGASLGARYHDAGFLTGIDVLDSGEVAEVRRSFDELAGPSAPGRLPSRFVRHPRAHRSRRPRSISMGDKVDEHSAKRQALACGSSPPTKVHWYRCREVEIGDGHRIRLRGSKHPELRP